MIGRLSLFAVASLALALAGCEVDPYCVTCTDDDDAGDPMDAARDASRRDAGPIDSGPDAPGLPDGCTEGFELCNDYDDDCDGEVDEGIDLMRDVEHCGGCDMFCGPPHSFPECVEGTCTIMECDVGWHDLDGMIENGCEYRCTATDTTDAVCDLRDNDCDGEVDEDVDFDNDALNCGTCGRVCSFAHSTASCVAGSCELGSCADGWHDLDGNPVNGCEYSCTPATPSDEVCNLRDDDCDGMIDEGDPGGGASCGISTGECVEGTTSCVGGTIQCMGSVGPTTELCNGLDDDCDGTADESNPEGGRLCGTRTGTCEQGREQCMGGSLVCIGAVGPSVEVCDNLDNDCDGVIDQGNPGGGGTCGNDTGECSFGTLTCAAGALVCMGGTGPRAELCDGLDNDCDGTADEGNPEGGGLCGTDLGTCSPGTFECMGGTLTCIGAVGPGTEVCDGLDNDCDGTVDDGNPDGGGTCGTDVGACTFGTVMCSGGALICSGGTGPGTESCNMIDDDCDGMTDEDFNLATDPRHCGMCGNSCTRANATAVCSSSTCVIASCNGGFVDLDGDPANGCEYACSASGGEVCNGRDDDCDGAVDEGLTAPATFCNPNGVCAATTATCGGSAGWVCNYAATPTYEEVETRCDGLDNDCDGSVDEPFDRLGISCTNGALGSCLRTGVNVCNTAGDGVVCNAAAPPPPGTETCNGQDDDCDGLVDDGMTPAIIPTVTVPRVGGGTVSIMRYEASRPDASAASAGTLSTHACGSANRVPWTTVTWDEAQTACCALNADGACPAPGSGGWRLCDAGDWETACEGPAGTCEWSYASSCTTSQPLTCNGKEHDCDASTPQDEDCLYTTGSSTFPSCRTAWSGGSVYDLSGNAREWTARSRGTNLFELRGGSFNNIEPGRSCEFDFTVAERTFAHPNTGFRCCFY